MVKHLNNLFVGLMPANLLNYCNAKAISQA